MRRQSLLLACVAALLMGHGWQTTDSSAPAAASTHLSATNDFGMDGDGLTDNGAAWAAMLAANDEANCRPVVFEPGTYLINTNNTTYVAADCVNLLCEEEQRCILDFQDNGPNLAIQLDTGADFTMRGFKVQNHNGGVVHPTRTPTVTLTSTDCTAETGTTGQTCRDTDDHNFWTCPGACPATDAWVETNMNAGQIVIERNWFDAIYPASDVRCVVDTGGTNTSGFDSLIFRRNRITNSRCVIDLGCDACRFGDVTIESNISDGNDGVAEYVIGHASVVEQGPLTSEGNFILNHVSNTAEDLQMFSSKVRQATYIGNHCKNIVNTGGDLDGCIHAQGNSDALTVIGNTALDMGIGNATPCEASLLLIKGASGEVTAAGNILYQSAASPCPGVSISSAGGTYSGFHIEGANRCMDLDVGDSVEPLVIENSRCRNTSNSTGGYDIRVRAGSYLTFRNVELEGMNASGTSGYGYYISCNETAGTCDHVTIEGGRISGMTAAGSEFGVAFDLSATSAADMTRPIVSGVEFVGLTQAIVSVGTATFDLVDPIIKDLRPYGLVTGVMNTLPISGTPLCILPDLSAGGREYVDADCNGTKDLVDAYVGALAQCSLITDLSGTGVTAFYVEDGAPNYAVDTDGVCGSEP